MTGVTQRYSLRNVSDVALNVRHGIRPYGTEVVKGAKFVKKTTLMGAECPFLTHP